MSGDASKLFSEPATKLRAITINGAVHVESEEDIKKREERRKQRASRWDKGSAKKEEKVVIRNMPTIINSSAMDDKSQRIYIYKMQIQEATMKLARSDLGIPANPRDRSPSPEPIYNNKGIRINTREDRTRNKLINQRNNAITMLKELDPTYQPPTQYKYKNTQLEDKVLIPADEHPEINFMGLLLGPRGNFLEEMKKDTKCNIIIRGKGSLKAGMTGLTKDGRKYEALDEPLHAFITGSTAEDVKSAARKVQELIDMQIYNPDCEKAVALRAKHMHELAVLNGTLKDIDMKCLNCGRMGHKTWQCDESSIFTASVICTACGGVGHLTSDCRRPRPGAVFRRGTADPEVIDKEYDAFLDDLGCPRGKKKTAVEKPYVPPMGDISRTLEKPKIPLMLTNGSSAPGAASAAARAITNGQQLPGGCVQIVGTSIFGGRMTRLTAGFKSQAELEMEKQKKKEEYENRPIPIEWQVERFESQYNKRYDDYLKQLEEYCSATKREPAQIPDFGPPPGAPGSGDLELDDLPKVIATPLKTSKT